MGSVSEVAMNDLPDFFEFRLRYPTHCLWGSRQAGGDGRGSPMGGGRTSRRRSAEECGWPTQGMCAVQEAEEVIIDSFSLFGYLEFHSEKLRLYKSKNA